MARGGDPAVPDAVKVFQAECRRYDADLIEGLLRESIDWLGIPLPRNQFVIVKPNVLGAYPPEKHVTTNPTVVEAVVRILRDNGNRIAVGDSSGNGQHGQTARALRVSGMKTLEDRYGVQVFSFDGHPADSIPIDGNGDGRALRLSSIVREADCIVNVPKMKSHQLMRYTGAVKNLFGCVPGAGKLQCHIDNPDPARFARLLLSIYKAVAPKIVLNIMDGIVGMEGPGPGPAGRVKEAGLLAVSGHAIALDYAVTEFLGARPRDILTTDLGIRQGLFGGEVETNRAMAPVPFQLPKPLPIAGFLHKVFPRVAMSRPYVLPEKCRKCNLCVKACPGGALSMDGYPHFDYSRCIYCYCCHENCPQAAIELKENMLLRLFKAFER